MRVTLENVDEVFTYQKADEKQLDAFYCVRIAIVNAAKVILEVVPDCADRTTALRKLREVRMDCNAAISLRGLI